MRPWQVTASRYKFDPPRIEVLQDDLVKIELRTDDIAHSLTIDAYRIAKRVSPGQPVTFEFRADQPGTFPFYCNLQIDDGCRQMRGELVVKPAGRGLSSRRVGLEVDAVRLTSFPSRHPADPRSTGSAGCTSHPSSAPTRTLPCRAPGSICSSVSSPRGCLARRMQPDFHQRVTKRRDAVQFCRASRRRQGAIVCQKTGRSR